MTDEVLWEIIIVLEITEEDDADRRIKVGRLLGICISEKRGTQKKELEEAEFIDDHGRAKVDIALCRGKKEYDKRQTLKAKEDRREMDRAIKRF